MLWLAMCPPPSKLSVQPTSCGCLPELFSSGPSACRYVGPYASSASSDPLYYSTDLPGVHLISLSAYRDYNATSAQYAWLVQDLERFDRSITPWLVVIFHPPIYK